MLLLVVCPLLVANRLPIVVVLLIPALAILTVLPLRLTSLERKISSFEKCLSLQDDALHRATIEIRALHQFQRSILALNSESLVRNESLAVAERLRFEALARSVESPQRM